MNISRTGDTAKGFFSALPSRAVVVRIDASQGTAVPCPYKTVFIEHL
jgi:hypothetical protein